MSTEDPEPCLPIVSILTKTVDNLSTACSQLDEEWDDFRLVTPPFYFDETDYYEDEMGEPLFRWWGYSHTLSDPSKLSDWKRKTETFENKTRDPNGDRVINVDPGYLNYGLVVLGSTKYFHQKIYLEKGVYADPVLQFMDGTYRPFSWSFPDFQDNRYYGVLKSFRRIYSKLRSRDS